MKGAAFSGFAEKADGIIVENRFLAGDKAFFQGLAGTYKSIAVTERKLMMCIVKAQAAYKRSQVFLAISGGNLHGSADIVCIRGVSAGNGMTV